jgi:hypothetical protein
MMWLEIATELSKAFEMVFDIDKVRRKWQTLTDGYKCFVDNKQKTGSARTKFEFAEEMDELLGSRHDIRPVVTGTPAGIAVHRPNDLEDTLPDSSSDVEETVSPK